MAVTIMEYLSVIPVSLFAVLVAVNVTIAVARLVHHDDLARLLQRALNRVAWAFRMGGGTHQQP